MTPAGLARRDDDLRELMDDPACDPERLRATLERFAIVNRLVAAWGTVYRTRIRPALMSGGGPVRLLDIGCGGGDVIRDLVGRARADGFDVSAVGIDPDERSIAVARAARPIRGIEYRRIDSTDLAATGERFDVVLSSHVLHHLTHTELRTVLDDSARLATRLAVHSDIARSSLAYAAYAVGITPLAPGSFLRTDGLRSIRRSWTPDELSALVPAGWRVEQPAPFRLLAVHRAGA
ncbi:methyltransferase domain-containing protein [Microbacterium sp.]|jgi:2-polyprenyl-3-methyl-5-hydroxy-6-metoxy-1,4-benzoquinol methylase|uniref:methyltransferase domain-containing protein n=1 Tax=Microbacterium sp. TaxID=51671 RepID=UPI002716C983|nr:methyltransferase domain-containing protein [Microbacterium sp.]MDO8383512.1 methyltransferase domain-containing protein [Microbacterium sp.]